MQQSNVILTPGSQEKALMNIMSNLKMEEGELITTVMILTMIPWPMKNISFKNYALGNCNFCDYASLMTHV